MTNQTTIYMSDGDVLVIASGGQIVVESGAKIIAALPTADPGLGGQLWNNSGVVNVSSGGGGGGGGDYVGPLDLTTVTAAAAFGGRALSSAMAGSPVLTIRRDSDDAEQSFSSDTLTGDLDISGINTFLGGANPFVAIWNDQSGNGLDASQSTALSQPAWVASTSNGKPGLSFDGSLFLVTNNISLPNSAFTIFALAKVETVASGGGRIAGINGQDIGFPDGPDLWLEFLGSGIGLEAGADGESFNSGNGGRYTLSPDAGTYYLFDTAWNDSSADLKANGAVLTKNSDYIYGDGNVGAINLPLVLGCDDPSSGGFGLQGQILEFYIFPAVLSSSDRTAIRQNIATYYGITLA
jgi:hypothetical protein